MADRIKNHLTKNKNKAHRNQIHDPETRKPASRVGVNFEHASHNPPTNAFITNLYFEQNFQHGYADFTEVLFDVLFLFPFRDMLPDCCSHVCTHFEFISRWIRSTNVGCHSHFGSNRCFERCVLVPCRFAMGCSARQRTRRALVVLVLSLARKYKLVLDLNRDSTDKVVVACVRRLMMKTHPDKGGDVEDQQRLNVAKEAWDEAKRTTPDPAPAAGRCTSTTVAAKSRGTSRPGPPPAHTAIVVGGGGHGTRRGFRINAAAVMLTYQSWHGGLAQWRRYNEHVKKNLKVWRGKHWCSTLETNEDGTYHAHLMLQFCQKVDRTSRSFAFEGIVPNCSANDLLGNGINGRNYQTSVNRGMFYVWCDKIGTARDECGRPCVDGNYGPCWSSLKYKYPVKGAWPCDLWKARKLTHKVYNEYLFDCRDGVVSRKRNYDAVVAEEEERSSLSAIAARTERIRSNPAVYQNFGAVPAAGEWLQLFKSDALRYPMLLVLAPSLCGKTEWACSLFSNPLLLKVGTLTYFPEAIRRLDRAVHDGLVLDDVRDLEFLADHQEKLQGKYNALVEFASTPGGTRAHFKDMFCLPIVATINKSTKNLAYLDKHDWVSRRDNVRLITFQSRPGG